jgi:hypothetical protein
MNINKYEKIMLEYNMGGRNCYIRSKLDTKELPLLYHTVKVNILKNADNIYELHITSLLDPNVTGYVSYNTKNDAKLAYDGLERLGLIVDYLYRNCKDYTTALDWGKIVADELKAAKDDYDPDKVSVPVETEVEFTQNVGSL